MIHEREIRTAARLYEARDTARALLGDKYAGRMAEGGKLLSSLANNGGESIIAAAARMAEVCESDGRPFAAVAILAAAAELLDPSGSA